MRMFRPIPRAALPDVMTVRLATADGGFGEPVVMAGVRFDETQKVSTGDHRSADNGSGIVFVDAVNTARVFEVPVGARISARYRRKLTFGDINGGLNYVADEDAKMRWGRWSKAP